MNLTGRKTAKISNKGLQPTTHKLSAMQSSFLATHLIGIIRGSSLTPDVRIKESALKMSKRVISGKVFTGSAHETTLPHDKPQFFVYNPSTATKRANMREIQKKMGLTAKFSRFL